MKASLWALVLATGSAVFGTAIPLGSFNGTHVNFNNVVADDGAPDATIDYPASPVLTGNQLELEPRGFDATGATGVNDTALGPIIFELVALPGVAVESFTAFGSGNFTLAGVGTAATIARSAMEVAITVLDVDGLAIAPEVLTPINASAAFNLLASPGIAQPWSVGMTLNIATQLTNASIPFTLGATRLQVTVTPQMDATTEAASVASMVASTILLTANTVGEPTEVPEPATFGLCGVGLLAAIGAARRKRG